MINSSCQRFVQLHISGNDPINIHFSISFKRKREILHWCGKKDYVVSLQNKGSKGCREKYLFSGKFISVKSTQGQEDYWRKNQSIYVIHIKLGRE